MTLTEWRKWRDSIASTFDLDDYEEERLREMFDHACASGIRHTVSLWHNDELRDTSGALETVGLR